MKHLFSKVKDESAKCVDFVKFSELGPIPLSFLIHFGYFGTLFFKNNSTITVNQFRNSTVMLSVVILHHDGLVSYDSSLTDRNRPASAVSVIATLDRMRSHAE